MLQLIAAFMPAEWKGWNWFQRVVYLAVFAGLMALVRAVVQSWLPPLH